MFSYLVYRVCRMCAALPFRVLPGLLGDIHLDVHDLEDEVAFSQLKVFSRKGEDVGEERLTGKAVEERPYAIRTNESNEGSGRRGMEGRIAFSEGGTFRLESCGNVFPLSQSQLLCRLVSV
jgi:hypothetical protein